MAQSRINELDMENRDVNMLNSHIKVSMLGENLLRMHITTQLPFSFSFFKIAIYCNETSQYVFVCLFV